MSSIALAIGGMYNKRRKMILKDMSKDRNGSWKTLAQRLDQVDANKERKVPSEWWILRYQVYQLRKKAMDGLKTLAERIKN